MSHGPPETQAGEALDLSRGKDREYLRRAVAKRWPIDQTIRDQCVGALKVALSIDLENKDSDGVKSAVRTFAALEGQNQIDELNHEKMERLDAGLPTDRLEHVADLRQMTQRLMDDEHERDEAEARIARLSGSPALPPAQKSPMGDSVHHNGQNGQVGR